MSLQGKIAVITGSSRGIGRAIAINSKLSACPWVAGQGDIRMWGEGWSFHFPIVTCIVVSVVLTVLLNLLSWFLRK